MAVVHDIPRAVLRAGLWVTRLPLVAAAAVRGDVDEWHPLLAFDDAAAGVREFVGGVLHDDELVRAAQLERARVSELRRASELESVARAAREQADAAFEARETQDEEQREHVEAQTARRRSAVEQEEGRRRRRASSAASNRKQSVRETEARTKEQLAKQDRANRVANIEAEREALHDERRAVAATSAALEAEREIRSSKAARTGSGETDG
ncbi:MAG: hypothetical protein JOZ99_14580 [Actinobacteria bacterium]|nr:hypothetical protein [Actinomycetota bacterium]